MTPRGGVIVCNRRALADTQVLVLCAPRTFGIRLQCCIKTTTCQAIIEDVGEHVAYHRMCIYRSICSARHIRPHFLWCSRPVEIYARARAVCTTDTTSMAHMPYTMCLSS